MKISDSSTVLWALALVMGLVTSSCTTHTNAISGKDGEWIPHAKQEEFTHTGLHAVPKAPVQVSYNQSG